MAPLDEAAYYEQETVWRRSHDLDGAEATRLAAVDGLLPHDVSSVLDVGAGDGLVLNHLAATRQRARLYAAERSWTAVSTVRFPSTLSSADALPMRDRSVDAALCCEVLEHLPGPVYERTRRELARVAARFVVVTVPNQEDRARSSVDCPSCGCRYNRHRHLRSFGVDDLRTLLPGFGLARSTAVGPRPPVYPRRLRTLLERRRLLAVAGDPMCPQCGERYRARDGGSATTRSEGEDGSGGGGGIRQLGTRLLPRSRRPYWLCALFERR